MIKTNKNDVVQSKAISNWVSVIIKEPPIDIISLTINAMVTLLETLSGTKCPYKYDKNPKTKFSHIGNLDCFVQFAISLGVKVYGINGTDLMDKNIRTYLALYNGIINRFVMINAKELKIIHQWFGNLIGQPIRSTKDWGNKKTLTKLLRCDTPFQRLTEIGVPTIVEEQDFGKDDFSMNLLLVYIYEKRINIDVMHKEMFIDFTGDKRIVEGTVEELKIIKTGTLIKPTLIDATKNTPVVVEEKESELKSQVTKLSQKDSTSTFSSSEEDDNSPRYIEDESNEKIKKEERKKNVGHHSKEKNLLNTQRISNNQTLNTVQPKVEKIEIIPPKNLTKEIKESDIKLVETNIQPPIEKNEVKPISETNRKENFIRENLLIARNLHQNEIAHKSLPNILHLVEPIKHTEVEQNRQLVEQKVLDEVETPQEVFHEKEEIPKLSEKEIEKVITKDEEMQQNVIEKQEDIILVEKEQHKEIQEDVNFTIIEETKEIPNKKNPLTFNEENLHHEVTEKELPPPPVLDSSYLESLNNEEEVKYTPLGLPPQIPQECHKEEQKALQKEIVNTRVETQVETPVVCEKESGTKTVPETIKQIREGEKLDTFSTQTDVSQECTIAPQIEEIKTPKEVIETKPIEVPIAPQKTVTVEGSPTVKAIVNPIHIPPLLTQENHLKDDEYLEQDEDFIKETEQQITGRQKSHVSTSSDSYTVSAIAQLAISKSAQDVTKCNPLNTDKTEEVSPVMITIVPQNTNGKEEELAKKKKIKKIDFTRPRILAMSQDTMPDSPGRNRIASLGNSSPRNTDTGKFKAAGALSCIQRQRNNTYLKEEYINPSILTTPRGMLLKDQRVEGDRLFKMEVENKIRMEHDMAKIRTFEEKKNEFLRSVDPNYLIKSYFDELKGWVGKEEFTIVFDSMKTNAFDPAGLSDLMVICVGKNMNIFGWYNSKKVPESGFIKNDPKHFMFTLQNQLNVQPSQIFPMKKRCFTFGVDDAPSFYLKKTLKVMKKEKVYVVEMGMKFKQRYKDFTLAGDGLFINKDNVLEKVIIVQWK
ncbi:hypothetical protein EIN_053330 [Entamoeba invadens IP1]|uniref:hypothetical protein n=1 Tax=Entamoeba invadens IP1 TaxID=370355 RepID=UPI0002C3DD5C|nr:hypothetical protein EIN_053330 [Entamoeba invadens IP1]ELP93088.1 hypothetical protein EIN_053330 [Entamoeba invadens IP1]|eukprot:XP_004259859.1 hypothetical protein EIN_053330 [Entamoeba invadens IP1]